MATLSFCGATGTITGSRFPMEHDGETLMPFWVRTLLVTGLPDEVEPVARRHLEHLRELHAAGRIRAAGEFQDGDGFLEIFEAADRREAESIAGASPLIEAGLATWMLREWTELEFS